GFPLNRTMWRPQIEALRDRFTVVAPDLRGFGEGAGPVSDLTMDTYAGDVLDLLDALELDRVALAGFSMGGYVAFRVVAKAAGRIRSLVIAGSRAGPDSEEARHGRHAAVERIRTEGPDGFLEEFSVRLVGPTTKAGRPAVLDTVRRIVGKPPASSVTAALAAMAARPDSRPLLASIAAPTLVIVGDEDTVIPPDAGKEIASGVRAGRLVTIPQAGHVSNLEAPEAFNGALREFLLAD
ncbi:MAG: alpha/beta fold hydrolase, partial [Candidatus Methylomirabilaceae bacterium]